MKVLAPYLAFSDITLALGPIMPHEVSTLHLVFPLDLCWHEWKWPQILLWCLAGVEWSVHKSFCLPKLSLLWFFSWRKQPSIGASFTYICWHFLVASIFYSKSRYMRQNENPGKVKLTTVSFLWFPFFPKPFIILCLLYL